MWPLVIDVGFMSGKHAGREHIAHSAVAWQSTAFSSFAQTLVTVDCEHVVGFKEEGLASDNTQVLYPNADQDDIGVVAVDVKMQVEWQVKVDEYSHDVACFTKLVHDFV
jgi:hypothetical protein